jgi:hypothetical protein
LLAKSPLTGWRAASLALFAGFVDCRCRSSATPDSDARAAVSNGNEAEPEFAMDESDARADGAAALPRCTVGAARMLVPVAPTDDADVERTRFEAATVAMTTSGPQAAMADVSARQLLLARSPTERATIAIGPEPTQAITIATAGSATLLWTVSAQLRARLQRAFVVGDGALRLLGTHRGLLDDSLGIASCSLGDSALVVWDESPTEGQSVVRAQRWTATTRADPPLITLSEAGQDASDPVIVAAPGGGAILAYLALQEVAVETANQSAADIIVRAINADGTPRGPAVNLTSRPKTRFGVALHATSSGRWIAWRLAADSDHEGLGDGGRVAIVALGEDLRPVRSPEYLTDLDRVPAGRISIVSEGATAEVYWTERRGEDLVTVRRAVSADGRVLGEPREEPALAGQVPFGGDAREPRIAVWGRSGEPGYAIARCPR